jgi:hypothetical protein
MMEREIIFPKETLLNKRIKGGLWVSLAGTLAIVLSLVIENVAMFELSDNMKLIVVLVATAIISQITHYLNNRNK